MIVNANQFQAIIVNKKEIEAKYKPNIDKHDIESPKSVKLHGITIADCLQFDQYTSNLCFKAAMQLNALHQLQKCMEKPDKIRIIISFVYGNFNYCSSVWHFGTCASIRKTEKNPNTLPENSP